MRERVSPFLLELGDSAKANGKVIVNPRQGKAAMLVADSDGLAFGE
jgi:hypothetical protein